MRIRYHKIHISFYYTRVPFEIPTQHDTENYRTHFDPFVAFGRTFLCISMFQHPVYGMCPCKPKIGLKRVKIFPFFFGNCLTTGYASFGEKMISVTPFSR